MRLISQIARALFSSSETRGRDPSDDFWYSQSILRSGQAIIPIGVDEALQIPAVIDAVDAITQPIAHLPFKLFKKTGTKRGDRVEAIKHPAYRVVNSPLTGLMTRYEWRGAMQWDLALHNNALAELEWGPEGLIGLRWYDWRHVTVEDRNGEPIYRVFDNRQNKIRVLTRQEVLHLKGLPLEANRLVGRSPIQMNMETLARALAVQRYSARYFTNDTQSGGIIEPTHPFKDVEDEKRFIESWRRARTGANAHKDALVRPGMKYNRSQLSNEAAQFIETQRELSIECARIWHVPPHKIRSLERATHSNIEQQSLEFVIYTMFSHFELWQVGFKEGVVDPLSIGAGLDPDDYFMEFNVAPLLRGDMLSRYRAFAIGRQWGWLSANDVREDDNRPGIGDEGNRYLEPMNMSEPGEEKQEDQGPPPGDQGGPDQGRENRDG